MERKSQKEAFDVMLVRIQLQVAVVLRAGLALPSVLALCWIDIKR